MNKQITIAALSDELKQVRTRKKEFLEQIDRLVPWDAWAALVEPYYPKGLNGNKPYPLERMLRIHVFQNLYDLSDMGTKDGLSDSRAVAEFCGIDSPNQVPDGDTIGRFRNLLVKHGLQERIFGQVVEMLAKKGLILKKGTIVDSTLIAAPSSTKKGNQWHFGYKAHIGADEDSGIVHHVEVTAANESDVAQTPKLLHGKEKKVRGDAGFVGAEKREDALTHNDSGEKIKYVINRRPSSYKNRKPQSKGQIRRREREKSSVRAKVEHVFAVVKKQLKFRKTRYRGLRKQTSKLNMMFALANLILADRPCLAA